MLNIMMTVGRVASDIIWIPDCAEMLNYISSTAWLWILECEWINYDELEGIGDGVSEINFVNILGQSE